MNYKLNLSSFAIVLFLLLSFQESLAQRTISAPALESGTQACASPGFNSFTFIATLAPGNALPNGNEFILEISAPDGTFDNQTEPIASVVGPNNGTASSSEIRFENVAIPTDANSDTYRFRVRASLVDNMISQPSADIAAHFFDDELQIILNNRNDVFICDGSTVNATISVRVLDGNNNQIDANSFEWEWLRDGAVVAGANGPSLQIDRVGTYYARVPLGKCQFFFAAFGAGRSNNVDVVVKNVGDVTISTTAPDFSYCPEETKRLVSSEQDSDFDYQWYKDNQPINGAISPIITLPLNNFQGEYFIEVSFGDSCVIASDPVTVNNEGSSITQELPENLILLPNQTINLEVVTDAPDGSPFRWIVETSVQQQGVVSGPSLTFNASFIGNYRVEIDANDPCNSELFSETDIYAPVGFEITIGTMGEDLCDQDTIDIELIEMVGRTNTGLRVPLTEEQLGFFDFEWFRDGVPLGETSLSLTIDRADSGGSYELRANLRTGEFTGIISNNLPISFLSNDIALTVSPESLPDDGSPVTITAPFDDDYTYEWYLRVNGEEQLIEGETNNTLVTNQEGTYFVRITSSICTVDSLDAVVGVPSGPSEIIPNVVTFNGSQYSNWRLPQSLLNDPAVEVTIFDSRGVEDLKTTNYQNNWPAENSRTQGQGGIYYYIITKNSAVVRKGSITVMR